MLSVGAYIVGIIQDVHDAPSAILNVCKEVYSLQAILIQLHSIIESGACAAHAVPAELLQCLDEVLKHCFDVKLDLREILSSYVRKEDTKKNAIGSNRVWPLRWSRWKWAMVKEKEVDKIRRMLEAHKATLGLTILMMSK